MARNSADIIRLLSDRLRLFGGGIYVNNISYEDDSFEPAVGEVWLQQDTMFAEPEEIGAFSDGGTYREQGIYQVTVAVPQGTGSIAASAIADQVASHFPMGLSLVEAGFSVSIKKVHRGRGRRESPWYKIPVIIEWWAYSPYQA